MLYFRILSVFVCVTVSSALVLPQETKAGGCNIDITAQSLEPIVTTPSLEFLYPSPDQNEISLNAGDTIYIACPGGQLTAGSIKTNIFIAATCVSGNEFTSTEDTSITFNFSSLKCSRQAFHTARYTGNSCEQNGKEIEIGYIFSDDLFAQQIRICFDDVAYTPLYSTYNLTKSIGHHESGVSRPSFIPDDFYNDLGATPNDLYVRNAQRSTINKLLGLAPTSTIYIQDNDYFLSRGHLTAKAAFVYDPQQKATFHYVNVAPQWQTFNGNNWNTVEMDAREYAEMNEVDLIVYTGTYGVTTLPHSQTKEEIPLYLYNGSNGKQALPVPELYWKALYDPIGKRGVVLLGVNNPYQHDVQKSVICQDISEQISWLNWQKDSLEFGYSYACTVDDFRQTVTYLPELEVVDLLG